MRRGWVGGSGGGGGEVEIWVCRIHWMVGQLVMAIKLF